MKRVEILFTKQTREQIKAAVADSDSDYQLPEDFDTIGQVFTNAITAYADSGFFMVEAPARDGSGSINEYYYPAHSIDRVKVVNE